MKGRLHRELIDDPVVGFLVGPESDLKEISNEVWPEYGFFHDDSNR